MDTDFFQKATLSEQQFREVLDRVPAYVFIKDLQSRNVYANKLTLEYHGVSEEELRGFDDTKFFPENIAKQMREADLRVFQGEQVSEEIDYTHPRLGRRIYSALKSPLYADAERKRIIGLIGISTDITERRLAERAVQKSEEQFRAAFKTAFDSYVLLGRDDGRIYEVNDRFEELYGFNRDEAIGKTTVELGLWVHPERRAQMLAELREKGHVRDFPVLARKKSGDVFDMLYSISDLPGTHPAMMLAVARDVTERNRAEQRIQDLNRVYAVLSEINQLIAREKDLQNVFGRACEVLVKVGGFRMAWIGRLNTVTQDVKPIASSGFVEGYLDAININVANPERRGPVARMFLSGEHQICNDIENDPSMLPWREAGMQRGYRAMAALPLMAAGKCVGVLAIYSAQKDLFNDEELRQLDELAVDIGFAIEFREQEKNRRKLEEQFRQAQKMEAIGQLAGGVAHDFNNILAAMMMQTELMQRRKDLPPDVVDGLRQIIRYSERAANLTRQLLLFGRKQMLQPRNLDLNELVTNLGTMLHRIIGEDYSLRLKLDPQPTRARADTGMLEQVVLNLVVNARDAMPGGGELLIETGRTMVSPAEAAAMTDVAAGSYVFLRVSDKGCGISPENMKHIFEPFFTTKELGKGTGLGLATVFGIIQQHRGFITVKTEVGKGTVMQVNLPSVDVASSGQSETSFLQKQQQGTGKILVVEDEFPVRELTRAILESAGYKVFDAANGIEAQRVWKEHKGNFDLLFTDMVMPEKVSGAQLAEMFTRENSKLRVIIASGYSAQYASRELVLKPGQLFLQKPYSSKQILEAVKQCLES